MKKELRELVEAKARILNEKKSKDGDVMNVSVPWIKSDIRNLNGRIYPKPLLQREVARVQSSVKKGSFIGTGDHPASGLENIETASHIVTALSLDENGEGTAELRILPTTRGKNIQTLIRNNATLGLSCRGFGEIGRDGTVLDDYKLMGLDIVMNPSFKNATFSQKNVFESVEFSEDEDGDSIKDREEAMYELLQVSYGRRLDGGGFDGTFNDYCELHEPGMRKIMHLPEEDGKTTVEKLTEEQVNKRIYSYYQEAVQGGFKGTISEWKEKFPKIVEIASESIKITEEKKAPEPKEPFKGKTTWEEIQLSGWHGTLQEYKEQFPDITIIKPEPPQKAETITEAEKKVREVEIEQKLGKAIKEKVIRMVSREVFQSGGGATKEQIKEMIEMEIKAEKERIKELNWQAYKRLLD